MDFVGPQFSVPSIFGRFWFIFGRFSLVFIGFCLVIFVISTYLIQLLQYNGDSNPKSLSNTLNGLEIFEISVNPVMGWGYSNKNSW